MIKKKRLLLIASFLALAWVAWKIGALVAAACLGGAVFLLLLLKMAHITINHFDMKKVKAWEDFNFDVLRQSLSQSAQNRPWSFAVLGDTRNNTAIASLLYQKVHDLAPVMAFHTGDIVRGGKASELLKNHASLLKRHMDPVPLFCIPGNHERGPKRDFAGFKALYGDDKFAFSHGDCLFVGFNNCTRKGVSEENLKFLDEKLAGDFAHKYVFTHIPPAFFEATFVKDTRRRGFKQNAEAFHQLMCRHHVEEIFMAHIHGYATTKRDNVRYTLTAGGGAPLSNRIAPENRHYHFIVLGSNGHSVERRLFLFENGRWNERPLEE
jgi:hypothetical protein